MGQSIQSREDLMALAKRLRGYARSVTPVFYAEKLLAVANELEARAQTLRRDRPHDEWKRAETSQEKWEPGTLFNLLT